MSSTSHTATHSRTHAPKNPKPSLSRGTPKATGACKIIGYALQDAHADGTIQAFANFGEYAASEVVHLCTQVNALSQENRALKEALANIQARLAALEQTAPLARNQWR